RTEPRQLTLNATAEEEEKEKPEGERRAVPPIAGEENAVIKAERQGPAHGDSEYQRT
ncbi:hypothetical protein, partial [Klebsiella pneumoniae]|uniref:hypothetical protein n=1 Tax=Klebsiella pneumoniae TaxID=573 RepID=UPI003B5B4862